MHEAPERSRVGAVIAAIVVTALVVGGGMYFWQQGQIQNLKDDVAAAEQSAQSAQESISKEQAKAEAATKELAVAQKELRKEQRAAHVASKELRQQKKETKQAKKEAATLADGKYFAYVRTATDGPDKVGIDIAEYFTGNRADKAAVQDGVIKKGEQVDNDVYIRNESKQVRTLIVSSSVDVKILTKGGGSPKAKSVSYAEFVKLFDGGGKDNKHLHVNGYWIVVAGGKVTSIHEQFQP